MESQRITRADDAPPRRSLYLAVACSGAAALVWELLWQHHAALALGASARGAAISLAAMMTGCALGGLTAARLAARIRRPLVAFAVAEGVVAAGGLAIAHGLDLLAWLDNGLYARVPAVADPARFLGTFLLYLLPAIAMGATIPILAPIARRSIAIVYAMNTIGGAIGIVLAAFVLLPLVGVRATGTVAAAIEATVALWALARSRTAPASAAQPIESRESRRSTLRWAAVSGFAVFMLEVAWFRSARAAYQTSTETFAILLVAFLLPLGFAGTLVRRLRGRISLESVALLAAVAVLVVTPAIDRLDLISPSTDGPALPALRFLLVAAILAPPVLLIGVIFPWLLAEHPDTAAAGRLYLVNTLACAAGALAAGFLLLPLVGATRTAWIAALLLAAAAIPRRPLLLAPIAIALCAAYLLDGGARRRVQGAQGREWKRVLESHEGAESTVSAVEAVGGDRFLVIDGFAAAGEDLSGHYMAWMGHLPSLAMVDGQPARRALVICFGTGQTANAVRLHRPERLDIVEIDPAVLAVAGHFPKNGRVLEDPIVHSFVMDGRAFLRRMSGARYDLVTLEPMAPNFAGTNSLYSSEFYELVKQRLSVHGVVAQWVPVHLLTPFHMLAVIATFRDAFPYTRLWLDPIDGTGILVGSMQPWRSHPSAIPLDFDAATIEQWFLLDSDGLARVAKLAQARVTDDNQLLAYGYDRLRKYHYAGELGVVGLARLNQTLLLEHRRAYRGASR